MEPLWDAAEPITPADHLPDLDVVTHVQVERGRQGGYHYLHETALAWHRGCFHLLWAAHPTHEVNEVDERLRGTTSPDGITWQPASDVLVPGQHGAEGWNHPVLWSDGHDLWGFFTRWRARVPDCVVMRWDGAWRPEGSGIPGFLPFNAPRRLPDGSLVISGEYGWKTGAVAISRGDPTRWELVQLPSAFAPPLMFPEVTLLRRRDSLVAIHRSPTGGPAPICHSLDGGRTWSELVASNLPIASSKPLCLELSNGQQLLLCNDPAAGRTLLRLAVTAPGGASFHRMWKLRHQAFPRRRLFGGAGSGSLVGQETEWSYPSAVEHAGRLFIAYTQGKEDAALSIVPLSAVPTGPYQP